MKKSLLGAAILLGGLLSAPAVMAYGGAHEYWETRYSDRKWNGSRHHSERIHHLRAKLDRSQDERRRVEWAYNQARSRGDWPTVRFQEARLNRLDREIHRYRYELRRAYEQARRDRYRHEVWSDEYSYRYN
ncbi:MAG TPA: hypothetical protein PLP22_02140 [Candidatus Competibacter sp.]|nr:hypothetical protein [Candidatus Competibacteraceae bacterium]HAO33265.1 hypothetical protein [Candidatus Competibacteraceae bacterium]HRE53577.1 hypothetical protein [Candidatus Competibacter sp.]HUM93905.1 hypothetical protein [Candidatus Competibacter sp.]